MHGLTDWFLRAILDLLKIDGVFSILPFQPIIGIGVGPRLGTVRITCELKIDGVEGYGEWVGDILDLKEIGPVVVVRSVQEDAIKKVLSKRGDTKSRSSLRHYDQSHKPHRSLGNQFEATSNPEIPLTQINQEIVWIHLLCKGIMEDKKKEVGSRVLQDYRLSVLSLGGMQMVADIIADTSRTDHCVNIEERSKHFDREGLLKILEKFHFRVVYKDDSDAYYVAPCNSTIFIHEVGDYIHTLRGAVRSEIYEDIGPFISNSPEIPIEPRLAYLNQKGAIREHTFSTGPFEPDNYAHSVIEGMNHVRKSFEGDGSYGRIAILSGPPGTGKTHLVTYMLGWNVLPIYISHPLPWRVSAPRS